MDDFARGMKFRPLRSFPLHVLGQPLADTAGYSHVVFVVFQFQYIKINHCPPLDVLFPLPEISYAPQMPRPSLRQVCHPTAGRGTRRDGH